MKAIINSDKSVFRQRYQKYDRRVYMYDFATFTVMTQNANSK